jgi:hypothetical protein
MITQELKYIKTKLFFVPECSASNCAECEPNEPTTCKTCQSGMVQMTDKSCEGTYIKKCIFHYYLY